MEDFARVEYCVLDKSDNNIEVFEEEEKAINFAKENNYARVLEVAYGEPDENGDEVELYATEIWSLDEDFEAFEGTVYYGENFSGVADVIETSDYSEIEAWTWNMLQQGLFVEIKNMKSGKSQRLTPEDISENGVDIEIEESLQEEIEVDSLKLANPKLKSWEEMYIELYGEDEYRDWYYDEYNDDYWKEPCQAQFDVVDEKGHKVCTLTCYKFDSNGYWYEVGIEILDDNLARVGDELGLEDLDVDAEGWFDDTQGGKNLLSVEDYEKLLTPYLEKIMNALK